MSGPKESKPGERSRDEARNDHHNSFAAGEWQLSDQREPDERFGKTRSDGGAAAESYVNDTDGDPPEVLDDDTEDTESTESTESTASSASPEGRAEEPRQSASREKPKPKPKLKP